MTRRRLTPEERALWRRVSRVVRPLKSGGATEPPVTDKGPVKLSPKKSTAQPGVNTPARRPAAPSPLTDPFSAGDPKAERRIRRGRKEIDAVFDLHGHTQSSARAALYGFLLEARARGYECVLIITGKGVRRDALEGGFGKGVLRARFRDWVREDDFRQHITRVSAAHPRHGGDGAFYVFLKRNRKARLS